MKRLLIFVLLVLLVVMVFSSVSGQSTSLWSADFYRNIYRSGSPVLTQTVNAVNFNWGTGSPGTTASSRSSRVAPQMQTSRSRGHGLPGS